MPNTAPVLSLFFTSWSRALRSSEPSSTSTLPRALAAALTSLSQYTPARPGDRTIIDALSPFCASLNTEETFEEAVKAAKHGAASTKGMKPKLGRATYVGDFGQAKGSTNVKQERDQVGQAPLPIPDLTTVTETAGQAIKHIADAAEVFVQSLNGEESEGSAGSTDAEGNIPPDPGAWGVAAIVEGVYEGLSGFKVTT
jgi:hypothetical protein